MLLVEETGMDEYKYYVKYLQCYEFRKELA
jgi:hypothetical protein